MPLDWKRICVVTSAYHVIRTQEIFNFIYEAHYSIDVIEASESQNKFILRYEKTTINAFIDKFSDVDIGNNGQTLNRLRERHLLYDGEVFSKI